MSLATAEIRKHFARVKQSRVQFIAAQARFQRAVRATRSDTARLERAMRHLEMARQELQTAFNEGLILLDAQAVQFVRQFKDEPAALEQIFAAEIASRGDQQRRVIKRMKT